MGKRKGMMLCIAVLCSGATGLVYEICWIRQASHSFGSTIHAMTAIVAIFFLGLSAGNFFIGKIIPTISSTIKTYGILEIGIGCTAACTPFFFVFMEYLYTAVYRHCPLTPVTGFILFLCKFLSVSFVMLPPTILMGATLPLLYQYTASHKKSVMFSISRLYSINTLGAVAGCIVCGFLFLPRIGINASIWISSLCNILCGIMVLSLNYPPINQESSPLPESRAEKKATDAVHQDDVAGVEKFSIAVLFFLSGCATLGNELIFTRYVSLIVHTTVYTYTISLAATLSGIVLGGVAAAAISAYPQRRLKTIFIVLQMLLCLSSALFLWITPGLWNRMGAEGRELQPATACFILFLLPAVFSGMSFPVLLGYAIRKPRLVGAYGGFFSSCNIAGGITGAMLFGFFMIPVLGIQRSGTINSGIILSAAAIAFWVLKNRAAKRAFTPGVIASCIVGVLWYFVNFGSPLHLPRDFLASKESLIDFFEGKRSNISVVTNRFGDTVLQIDRLWQGNKRKTHQIMAAHIPMILHENPRAVCVIGLGIGQTAQRFLMYPISRLDCVDIEESLPPVIKKYFSASWLDDPRVHVIIDDGRDYIMHTARRYDIVSIEIGQLFRPYAAAFYTREFYERVKNRITEHGIVSQFIPLSFLSQRQLLSVIKTFLASFPYSTLWFNNTELLLLGSLDREPRLSSNGHDRITHNRLLSDDLSFSFWGGSNYRLSKKEAFAAGFIAGPQKLAEITRHASSYSDDCPILEYETAGHQQNSGETISAMADTILAFADDIKQAFAFPISDSFSRASHFIRYYNFKNISAVELLKRYYRTNDLCVLQAAAALNPYNLDILLKLGAHHATTGDFTGAETFFEKALSVDSMNSFAWNNLGLLRANRGKEDEACTLYSRAIELDSANIEAYINKAAALYSKGSVKEAKLLLETALSIRPDNKMAKINLTIVNNALNEQ